MHLGRLVPASAQGSEEPETDPPGTQLADLASFLDFHAEGIGGGIVAIISAVVLCGGLLLHNHYQPLKQQCDSGVGSFAQEVSSSALKHCSLNGFLADMGLVIALLSGFMLVVGVVVLVVARQRGQAADEL